MFTFSTFNFNTFVMFYLLIFNTLHVIIFLEVLKTLKVFSILEILYTFATLKFKNDTKQIVSINN